MTGQPVEPEGTGSGGVVPDHLQQEITVSDNEKLSRYEIFVDGERAGFAQYQRRGDQIIFTHTEIDPVFEGRGVGSRLAMFGLDDARSRHLHVVPSCPFIAAHIKSHPEYADLLGS